MPLTFSSHHIHLFFSTTSVQCPTTLGTINHITQVPAVSGNSNPMSMHRPQLVSSSNAGVFRQVIVTDSSGNKVHGIAGPNQSPGLTLPQKPTPPGITLVKPVLSSSSIAGKGPGANPAIDNKLSSSSVIIYYLINKCYSFCEALIQTVKFYRNF